MQHILNSRRASKGSPRTLDKMENKAEIREGLEQKRKSRGDATPYKFMRRNVRQHVITSLRIIVRHIFSKPHKEYDSMHIIKY
jgi:hypothetical protein